MKDIIILLLWIALIFVAAATLPDTFLAGAFTVMVADIIYGAVRSLTK